MGVQVWADTDDCTGGLLTASMTDFLDEYSKRPVAIFSLNHPHRAPTEDLLERSILNQTLSLSGLYTLSSHLSLVPLSVTSEWGSTLTSQNKYREFADLCYQDYNLYSSSAILATAIDTATLPFRNKNGTLTFSQLFDYLTFNGRLPVSSCRIKLPFATTTETLRHILGSLNDFMDPLSPGISKLNTSEPFTAQYTVRGAFNPQANSLLSAYAKGFGSRYMFMESTTPVSVQAPFPDFFVEKFKHEVNCITCLETGAGTGGALKKLSIYFSRGSFVF
ncbi:protein misato homolog 1-like isoform X2 [Zophobas morio]|uniref:protein misato homolog 1-like isoform X2 n=1 Tax=Zophobas morio TaxID=2755281 RepID=UPI003082A40D